METEAQQTYSLCTEVRWGVSRVWRRNGNTIFCKVRKKNTHTYYFSRQHHYIGICHLCMCVCKWRVKIDFHFTCRGVWQMQWSYIYACKLIKLEAKTSNCTQWGENVFCAVQGGEQPKSVYSLVHQEKLVTLAVQASPFTREHVSLNEDRLTYSALEPAAFPPTRERALCKSVKIIQTNQYRNKHDRLNGHLIILFVTWILVAV